jgi:hypothetical protein
MDYLEIKDGKNLESLINNNSMFNDQQEIVNFIVHSADISHSVKEWSISEKWSNYIYLEFFKQGDKEKSQQLIVSMFCDRSTTSIPKAQIGFIAGIISPTYDLLIRLFPNLSEILHNINNNNDQWEKLAIEEEKLKEIMKIEALK